MPGLTPIESNLIRQGLGSNKCQCFSNAHSGVITIAWTGNKHLNLESALREGCSTPVGRKCQDLKQDM
jgi:hypothetical protein